MIFTYAQVDKEHNLPPGSAAKAAISKHAGQKVSIANAKYRIVDYDKLTPWEDEQKKTPAEIEEDVANTLYTIIKKEIRLLGTTPVRRAANGVIEPMSNDEWDLYATSKLRGTATLTAARAASSHVRSMMAFEKEGMRLKPEDITPVLFRNTLPNKECWARIDVDDTPLHEPPEAFAEFLSRVKTPEQRLSLVRWVGSILDMDSDRSEYLYLHGEGNDGKSAFIRILNEIMGPASQSMSTDILKNDHGSTALEGKRLVIFNEENSTSFAKSATLKRLTGDEAHLINPKNAQLRKALLQCKVLYTSNFAPVISGMRADVRRLAYVVVGEFKPGIDNTFKVRLKAQAGDMMRYCWSAYLDWKAANPNGGKLGDLKGLEDVIAESTSAKCQELFDTLFKAEANALMTAQDVNNLIDDHLKGDRGDFANRNTLINMVRKQCGASVQKKYGGRNIRCYLGITRNTDQPATSANVRLHGTDPDLE